MGWNSWNQFLCNINETLIIQTIDAFHELNAKKYGYEYVIIDDCWQAKERDADGNLQPDPIRFPRGIKYLADYAHSKGLKLGIYSDVGYATCQKLPGSYGYYEQDAKQFAKWEVDYLKFDFCNLPPEVSKEPWRFYQKMSDALLATKRPILYAICNWGLNQPWTWAPKMANMWRTTHDIFPYYPWVFTLVDMQNLFAKYAGPGHWNDPDILEVGVNGNIANQPWMPKTNLTERECRSHFDMWSIVAAPLILGHDIRKTPEWVKKIIFNEEVIQVNQDKLGVQGTRVYKLYEGTKADLCVNPNPQGYCKRVEVWAKPLSDGKIAVLFFNRGHITSQFDKQYKEEDIEVTWEQLGLRKGQKMFIRDILNHKDLGIFEDKFIAKNVLPHGDFMIVMKPTY